MKTRPTLADVARAAGVSKTTASMALNGKGSKNIPDSTRERVVAAASALHFHAHGVARALTRRRADVLGILCTLDPFVTLVHHEFEHSLLSAIFSRVLEGGYNPLIYGYPEAEATKQELLRYGDGRSDAFILLYPSCDSPLIKHLHALGMPVVTLGCRPNEPGVRWVDSENAEGIRAAVAHLADLGHRRIAYLTGPEGEDTVRARVTAFREALAERGLSIREDWIVPYTWDTTVTGAQLERFMADATPPTALLTWYDFAAGDVYQAAQRIGLRIPDDLSVVGFDDTRTAAILTPSLTTVRQDPFKMGRVAVDLVLAALSEERAEPELQSVVCPVELVVRQSTAPPSQSHRVR